MMKRINSIAISFALLVFGNFAKATTVPLNTGYDHWFNAVYLPAPPVFPPSPSITRDDYWINIASYPATTPPTDRSFLIYPLPVYWQPAWPNTSWISAWSTNPSQSVTTGSNPETAYTLFRKCYCLQKGFSQAQVSFRVRADDTIQMWLNSQLNTLLPPSWGNYGGPGVSGGTTNQGYFHVGMNCVYALVEDFHGNMGFDLDGNISANGLLATPAKGTAHSFEPCSCSSGPAGIPSARAALDDDRKVINEIVKIAEARRTGKQKIQYEGREPKN